MFVRAAASKRSRNDTVRGEGDRLDVQPIYVGFAAPAASTLVQALMA